MIRVYFEHADEFMIGIEEVKEDLGFVVAHSEQEADCVINIATYSDQEGHGAVDTVTRDQSALSVQLNGRNAEIAFGNGKVKLFRGLMLLSEALHEGREEFSALETPYFKSNGMFLDLARNMALTVDSLKYFLRKSAIMGLNTITFYLEDLYEVEGYPYFGYMRGRYSKEDFRELCVYGDALGVEIVPYVEFFSHMGKFLGYQSCAPFRCDGTTFLFGEKATYDLIEAMVKSLRESFTTGRICVGGDEVFEANKGAYYAKNGERPLEDVFFEHANEVYNIVTKYGFKPFLSNDMYFYFRNNETLPPNHYACVDTVVFEEGIENKVPLQMGKIFWNYLEEDEGKMVNMMNLSKKLGGETMWLGSVRMWQSLCIQYSPTITNAIVGINACKKAGIGIMAFCTFEDRGALSHFLALPAFLACAELDYAGEYNEEVMNKRVKFLFGAEYTAFLEMERADFIHQNGHTEFASLFLLYNDPLIGLLDKEIEGMDLKSYYHQLSEDYADRDGGSGPIKLGFEQFKCMVSILELKADYGLRLKAAYESGDRESLYALAEEALVIKQRFERLLALDREMYTRYYRGFGSEKSEMKKATMVARFETVRYRILKYLNGEIEKIDELEEEKLRYNHCRFEDTTGVNIFFGTGFEKILTEA